MWIQAEVHYDPGSGYLTLSLIDLTDDRPRVIETGLIPLGLQFLSGSPKFTVDELSITSYFDAADFDPSTTSLVADIVYHDVWFETCCSE